MTERQSVICTLILATILLLPMVILLADLLLSPEPMLIEYSKVIFFGKKLDREIFFKGGCLEGMKFYE